MPDSTISVEVILYDSTGIEVDRATFNVPGSHEFRNLPPHIYTVLRNLPDGFSLNRPNLSQHNLTAPSNDLLIVIGEQDLNSTRSSDSSLLKLILATVIGIALLGDLPLVQGLFSSPIPNPTTQLQQSSSPSPSLTRNTRQQSQRQAKQNARLKARIRHCLEKNLESLLEIPSLTGLLLSLEKEDENNADSLQAQIIFLHEQVEQLRATIDDCDPTLIQELMAAEDRRVEQEKPRIKVRVEAELVNVRQTPNLDSPVIAQVSAGTVLQLDLAILAYSSEQQRLEIEKGKGWYPIVLPSGEKGYIYSRYASKFYD